MNEKTTRYTIEFSEEERVELLSFFKYNPKWRERIEWARCFFVSEEHGPCVGLNVSHLNKK